MSEQDMKELESLIASAYSDDKLGAPLASDLMNYLLGSATPEQEEWCLDALVTSASLRKELIQLQRRLSAETVMELVEDPIVGNLILSIVREALSSLSGTISADRQFPANVWRSVGQEWRRRLSAPRFAHARGADDLIGVKGTELKIEVKSDVQNGNLHVELDPGSVELAEPMTFAVKDPGGVLLPIWHGRIGKEPVSLEFEGLGQKLGFDDGPLPNAIFSLSLQGSFPDQGGFIDLRLLNGQSVTLRLADKVSIDGGVLRVSVDVSAVDRSKSKAVQLLLQLGSVEVLLGVAKLQESQSTLDFEAEIPQIHSLEIWGTSLLRLRAI